MAIYKSIFVDLLREALNKFNSDNIKTVTVTSLGMKDFLVVYYISTLPSSEDTQIMENIKDKIFADSYKCVNQLKYHWRRISGSKLPSFAGGEVIVYDKNENLYSD